MPLLRRGYRAGAWAATLFMLLTITQVGHSHAIDYRYWTYWTAAPSGAWQFASAGPAAMVPKDGAVEGWRFVISSGTNAPQTQPRVPGSTAFDQFCGDTPAAASGKKRVAVVIDYGTAAHQPPTESAPAARGTCVVAAVGASGAAILSQAAAPRVAKGLICGIDGYPKSECAVVVSPSASPNSKEPTRSTAKAKRQSASPASEQASTEGSASAATRSNQAAPSSGDDATPEASRKGKSKSDKPTVAPSPSAAAESEPADLAAAPADGPEPTPTFVAAAPDAGQGASALPFAVGAITIMGAGVLAYWRSQHRGSG